jgi:hypothetical protein
MLRHTGFCLTRPEETDDGLGRCLTIDNDSQVALVTQCLALTSSLIHNLKFVPELQGPGSLAFWTGCARGLQRLFDLLCGPGSPRAGYALRLHTLHTEALHPGALCAVNILAFLRSLSVSLLLLL